VGPTWGADDPHSHCSVLPFLHDWPVTALNRSPFGGTSRFPTLGYDRSFDSRRRLRANYNCHMCTAVHLAPGVAEDRAKPIALFLRPQPRQIGVDGQSVSSVRVIKHGNKANGYACVARAWRRVKHLGMVASSNQLPVDGCQQSKHSCASSGGHSARLVGKRNCIQEEKQATTSLAHHDNSGRCRIDHMDQ